MTIRRPSVQRGTGERSRGGGGGNTGDVNKKRACETVVFLYLNLPSSADH